MAGSSKGWGVDRWLHLGNENALNQKHEIRNPKQYLMTEIQMTQTMGVPCIVIMILFLSLGHLIFEFVSNFEIRISDFHKAKTANHTLWIYAGAGPF